MVLRIEDTDVDRSEARFENQLIGDLKWLGLDWDEGPDVGGSFGPYRQSDRLLIYREHAERLLSERKAYLCFCTEAELQQERERAAAEHRQPIYSGKCRANDPAEAQHRRASGEACAIRLRIPEHPIRFHDIVHGPVEFSNEVVSDPIILRSSGMPVYNYVVVIDVGADRERLSKRHGATSIANFRDMGVLPEALVNYLALLGWAPPGGTREIFSMLELVKEFSLERVTPSPAVFDMEKLYWLNRHYIKEKFVGDIDAVLAAGKLPDQEVIANESRDERFRRLEKKVSQLPPAAMAVFAITPFFSQAGYLPEDFFISWSVVVWLARLIQLFILSIDRLDQLAARASLVFNYDAKAALASPDNADVLALPHTDAVLTRFTVKILEDEAARDGNLTPERFKQVINEVKAETGAKGKELFHPIRIVITGSHSGPEFDKLIPILEEGSHLPLPKHVLSVRERVEEFAKARGK